MGPVYAPEPETFQKVNGGEMTGPGTASGDLPVNSPSTPGAVPVAPQYAWNFTSAPATYTLQSGDTLSGLAATYLGNGKRWNEIWAVQTSAYKSQRDPDHIYVEDIINMPDEAAANAKAWYAIPPGGDHPDVPGHLPPGGVKDKPGTIPWWGWVLGTAAASGVVFGGAYAASRMRKSSKRAA